MICNKEGKVRRLVVGDIHGNYKALVDVLDRARFNCKEDLLIGIGDYVDGLPDTKKVIEYLINVPHFKGVYGNHDCHSSDTQALTKKGWKNFKEINYFDEILSLDVETGEAVWDTINKIVIKPYNGFLYNFKTNRSDMLVTEDHRILCKNPVKKGEKYFYKTIKEGLPSYLQIPSNGKNKNTPFPVSDNVLKLCAWCCTDGSVLYNNTSRTKRYVIYQSKPRMVKRIEKIINDLGVKYSKKRRARRTHSINNKRIKSQYPYSYEFHFKKEDTCFLDQYFTPESKLPNFIFDVDSRQFKLFLHECILADGSYYSSKRPRKTCILYGVYSVLEEFQSVCVMNGLTATLVRDNRGSYRLNICEKEGVQFYRDKKITKVPYVGDVWCLNVPRSNFMVRRNGKAFFSGNCWARGWMSRGFTPGIWTSQGGDATLKSYNYEVVEEHKIFLNSLPKYMVLDNILFVHGGYNPKLPIENQIEFNPFNPDGDLTWDRALFYLIFAQPLRASEREIESQIIYDKVFIGHTTTQAINPTLKPLISDKVVNVDTGAGWNGKLTVMDVDTLEYWQSELVEYYYPEYHSR